MNSGIRDVPRRKERKSLSASIHGLGETKPLLVVGRPERHTATGSDAPRALRAQATAA